MKIQFIFILFLTILLACKNGSYKKAADEIAANLSETTNMNRGKDKYTLYVPKGWTTKNSTHYGVDYYFLTAPYTKVDPNTNINFITEYMQNMNTEDFRMKSIISLTKAIPSASVLELGDVNANGLRGKWYSCTMEPQGIKSFLKSFIFPHDGVAYIITGGTQLYDSSRYIRTFDTVAQSLRFVR